MQVCFIGHRVIKKSSKLIYKLKKTIVSLINIGATTFLFGSKSEFNDLSWEIVTKLKETYPFIKRVYVRSAYQYIDNIYEKYLLESYEKTYFPPAVEKANKCSYIKRNYEMIDSSSFCVFYYNKNYTPPLQNNKMLLFKNSGTRLAYNYAVKKKKTIINLYQLTTT